MSTGALNEEDIFSHAAVKLFATFNTLMGTGIDKMKFFFLSSG